MAAELRNIVFLSKSFFVEEKEEQKQSISEQYQFAEPSVWFYHHGSGLAHRRSPLRVSLEVPFSIETPDFLTAEAFTREPGSIPFDRFAALEQEIERARQAILQLTDNWDGEGSAAYAEKTVERAVELARDVCAEMVIEFRGALLVPTIGPAAEGSIDLFWRSAKVSLLVNIPAQEQRVATYSGRRGDETLSGKLSIQAKKYGHLATWLAAAQ